MSRTRPAPPLRPGPAPRHPAPGSAGGETDPVADADAGMNRRRFAVGLLGVLGAGVALAACGDGEAADDDATGDDDASGDDDATTDDDTTADDDATADDDTTGDDDTASDDDTTPSGDWASGGTASMEGPYPDPFEDDLGNTCALTCTMTLGPCYAETMERQDVSEGQRGLPTRLALRVVDDTCTPVVGAEVDIWHTSREGLYSGEDAVEMCTLGDPEAISHRWFRGIQVTDASGRVDFDTCFPGWYGGRAIHIHFQVRRGGDAWLSSQLFFDQALVDEICGSHPDYAEFGMPDTTNAADGIFPSDDPDPYVLETARMKDGALQAWKTLVLRSSLEDDGCNA